MRPRIGFVALALSLAFGASGCGSSSTDAFQRLVVASAPESWRAHGDDMFEVWICHVPADSTATIYGGLPLRRSLTPAGVARLVGAAVTPYFLAISHGAYRPVFVAGGEVDMAANDEPQQCIDRAIAGARSTTRAVLAVADAEHAPGQQGGVGDAGIPTSTPAAVAVTHRSAYVGASDFNPSWGDHPPMDLVEHEVGHTLGWVHSGTEPGPPEQYLSALDVMSNSAAPYDADHARRDAPDTLAIDRVLSGWLPLGDVRVATSGTEVQLAPSTGASGVRLLVLPVDGTTFLTVELLTPDGYDGHLPHAGLAVHRVTVRDGRPQDVTPLTGGPPYTALLEPGAGLEADGWRLTAGPDGRATVRHP